MDFLFSGTSDSWISDIILSMKIVLEVSHRMTSLSDISMVVSDSSAAAPKKAKLKFKMIKMIWPSIVSTSLGL